MYHLDGGNCPDPAECVVRAEVYGAPCTEIFAAPAGMVGCRVTGPDLSLAGSKTEAMITRRRGTGPHQIATLGGLGAVPRDEFRVASSNKVSSASGSFAGLVDTGDYFGYDVAFLGDLAGDGTTAIAVGARSDD